MVPDEFFSACRKIGAEKALSQAGGGNISLKLDGNKMAVKSSGIELANVYQEKGVSIVDYRKISGFVQRVASGKIPHEKNYMTALAQGTISGAKPSMETGFHSLLSKAVVHTHPIGLNSLACAKNGKKMLENCLGEKFTWIPYSTPGVKLSIEIEKALRKQAEKPGGRQIIILESHGLIVSAESMGWCVQKAFELNNRAEDFMRRQKVIVFAQPCELQERGGMLFCQGLRGLLASKGKKILAGYPFPDSAVYYSTGFGEKGSGSVNFFPDGSIQILENNALKRKRIKEALGAHLSVAMNIAQFAQPRFLKGKEVEELREMESEKERKEAAA